MYILFVVDSFPVLSETFIVNQIYDLFRRGYKIWILARNRGDVNTVRNEQLEELKNRVIYFRKRERIYHKIIDFIRFYKELEWIDKLKLLRDPLKFYKFPVFLFENKIDIIHCHFGENAVWFQDNFSRNLNFKRAKKICTFHGFDLLPKEIEKSKIRYNEIFSTFNFFTYNTPYLGEILNKVNNKIKVHQLPVGINIKFLNKFYKEKKLFMAKNFTLIFVGRLIEWKGVLLLPEIIAALKQDIPDIQLKIIGEGECKGALNSEIKRLKLTDNIILLGGLNQDQVFKHMSDSDVFIFPGKYDDKTFRAETQGLVVQEAQFLGLPVLVSSAGGAKYGVKDGETGFVVEIGDIQGFVGGVKLLHNNTYLYHKMSLTARDFVINNYDIRVLNDNLLDNYING